ncbi:hypothetical protein DNTS_021565 [Danionella cerebrum]|uniref:RHD domain-containing protein n=1 Tax=Danionella cerebrum TaxID=2873325 RepID=A0A553QXH2_9TELE|nr:hypothetical protein DNTS_021565 [Danionella translucida]
MEKYACLTVCFLRLSMSPITPPCAALDLDIINEYLLEKTRRELPGPPAPPVDAEFRPQPRTKRNPPVLVSRGAAPLKSFSLDQTPITSMHSMKDLKVSPPRHGPATMAPQCLQRHHTGTEHLENFLDKPELVVVEQPKERGMRFRYECEGRSAGSILGATSTDSNKTLPAIEVQGPIDSIKKVTVTVSLVTKDIPYRPHPHCLVGKDCLDGICVIQINPHSARRHGFANLGIQCVRRKELEASLQKRRNKKIDPFQTGHSKSIEDMDMNVVRLCFQCELERKDGERISLNPVVSNPIYDKKATTTAELKINRLNVIRGPCTGKTEIYMLCDKVQKDDIEIIFSTDDWEAKAEFAQTDVHRQIAIVFKSPPFREQNIPEEVEVNVCLRRMSDRMDSEPVKFTYFPDNSDPYGVNRKRKMKTDVKFSESCSIHQSQTIMNEPSTSQQFDPYYTPAEYSTASASMPMPSQDGGIQMDCVHYNEDYKQEDGCISLDSEALDTFLFQYLAQQDSEQLNQIISSSEFTMGLEGNDTNTHQPVMNMASINDAHFSQMVSENQPYPTDLDNIDGLFSTVKTENDPSS